MYVYSVDLPSILELTNVDDAGRTADIVQGWMEDNHILRMPGVELDAIGLVNCAYLRAVIISSTNPQPSKPTYRIEV